MGIPKFYRYLSERYPLINEVVTSPQYLPVCDYLYLDLNGVIHNATHGDSITQGVKTEDTVASYIMGYISHIFKQVKPRKVMFIAVDGVAPRAKLNQQRSRRYRSALDAFIEKEESNYEGSVFDSNCITPGTEFMDRVDKILEYFINKKLLEDPLWKNTKVIYSSHSDPGEGEHKIMSYIRSWYTDPKHDATERHCIYGLDADLILLSLSLHDVNVVLLREIISFFTFMNKHDIDDRAISQSKWQILHVGMLREYLLCDLSPVSDDWIQEDDHERLLDDFVFLMILLGDDFLPEIPSLDINEGSIQLVIDLYKSVISNLHCFLVEDAKPVLPVLQLIFSKLGEMEEEVFQERDHTKREKKKQSSSRFAQRESSPPSEHPEDAVPGGLPVIKSPQYVKKVLGENSDFRQCYYFEKLNIQLPRDQAVLSDVCKCYYEGLQWVLLYYYRGVPSWGWYYPYHYSPLATDLATFKVHTEPFTLGKPFTPFLQQLGCLPPQSSAILPSCYRQLVLAKESPIIEYYPPTFAIDMNGKVNPWEGVNLIPFIDEKALREAVKEYECDEQLSEEEKKRNAFRSASIYSTKNSGKSVMISMPFKSTLFPPFPCPNYRHSYAISPPQGKQECVIHDTHLPGSFFIPVRKLKVESLPLGIVTTGRTSKHKTLVVSMKNTMTKVTDAILAQLAKQSCDKIVRYPVGHSRCAWVNTLYTRKKHAFIEEGHVEIEDLSSGEIEILSPVFDQMSEHAKSGRFNVIGSGGMDIGDVTILAELYPVVGSKRNPLTGEVEFRYATDSILYPYHLLSGGTSLDTKGGYDERLCALPSVPTANLIGPSTPCVFIGPGEYKGMQLIGCRGIVKELLDDRVRIQLQYHPGNVKAGTAVVTKSKYDKWYSISDMCRLVQMGSHALLSLISYYPIHQKNRDGLDHVGLNWVFKGRINPDYVQCVEMKQTYPEEYTVALPYAPLAVACCDLDEKDKSFMRKLYFSKNALLVLMDFKHTYPTVFNKMVNSDGSYDMNDLFTDETEYRSVVKWMRNQRENNKFYTHWSSRCCNPQQAKLLQQVSDKNAKENCSVKITLSCPINYIAFWEREYLTVSPSEEKKAIPSIGDRIVVTGGNDIPLGSYGFVVGVHPNSHLVEVVMDKPFIGGTDLLGLLSVKNRGAVISWEQCYPLK